MPEKPKILKEGNDPNCIHHERINSESIGTCQRCGRVRDYKNVFMKVIDPAMKNLESGIRTMSDLRRERSSKGGKRGRRRKSEERGKSI